MSPNSKVVVSQTSFPSSMDISPSPSDAQSLSMESMTTCESLKSPEVEYLDGNDVAAISSIERKTSDNLHIYDHLETSGNVCKREILAGMDIDKVVNIDGNYIDPQFCATIACDIYKHLRESETQKRPSTDFMEKIQKDINASMRAILIDWLVEVSEEYRLVPDTLYLTVNYIDRYLSGNAMNRQRLQLLGVACMMVAAKYEEICAPQVEEFCYITDNTYFKEEVLQMESSVLNFLKFEMTATTTKCFLRRFVRAAQATSEALVQMRNWFIRFPIILQACESIIEMLRGQYAHSVGCFNEAAFHFVEAAKLTECKSVQAMCKVYAAISCICIGDAESSSRALDLIGPVYRVMDSFVGAREKTGVLFGYGLLLMKQQNLQEARIRLASGLQMTHSHLGNLQLVSQYLTVLGSLALALHDAKQAREILRSSLTLAKKLNDVPTQIWVLSVLSELYQALGERDSEMENSEYQRKKIDDLQKRLADAYASIHHMELIKKDRIEIQQLHEFNNKRATASSSMKVNLDIPESVGLAASTPITSSSRLVDLDSGRRGKRRI